MAVLSRDDFMARINERVGDDNSDDALSFIEDMTDTFDDLSSSNNTEEWEKKYNELDTMWREKYKARFMNTGTDPRTVIDEQEEDIKDDGTETTFDDLFAEREG